MHGFPDFGARCQCSFLSWDVNLNFSLGLMDSVYSEITQSRSAQIGPLTVIDTGTTIGSDTKITNSVVGKGCVIGSNVLIEGSYVWDNVTIEDGCELRHAIVCDGVVMKCGSVLKPGVVLSFKVIITWLNKNLV